MTKLKVFLQFIIICFTFGCSSEPKLSQDAITENIDVALVHNNSYTKELTESIFIFSSDTLVRNINLSWSELADTVSFHLKSIDSLNLNKEYKQLFKSYFLADLVFSLFSTHFLGSKIGQWDDSQLAVNFNELSVAKRYELVNTNQLLLSCGEMSHFFKDLADMLLGDDVLVITNSSYHTFPLLKTQGEHYIIDPFDPILLFSNGHLLSYEDLISNNYDSLSIYRTSRAFGNTRDMVSKRFYNSLIDNYGDLCLKELLIRFVNDNSESTLRTNALTCYELSFLDTISYQMTNMSNGMFSIEQSSRMSRYPLTENVVRRDYLGETCN